MRPQLMRDMQWWTQVPAQSNGKPIQRPAQTAPLHIESLGYGRGAVLNSHKEVRGFWSECDEAQHITWKEVKAMRVAVRTVA
jgi:hypothetical protein